MLSPFLHMMFSVSSLVYFIYFFLHFLLILYDALFFLFFFFNDTATTEIYTLSLHDALPISRHVRGRDRPSPHHARRPHHRDRKSTRLNSSHSQISYAVFCLKKKKKKI